MFIVICHSYKYSIYIEYIVYVCTEYNCNICIVYSICTVPGKGLVGGVEGLYPAVGAVVEGAAS